MEWLLKRIKRNSAVCYVRTDRGKVESFPERKLRPEPVIISLATPLQEQEREDLSR
jgi:hypothetical protein